MFKISPLLLKDCEVLGKFQLCYVLLMRDAHYPWFILVPDREDMIEIFDLSIAEQSQLQIESNSLSSFLKVKFNADKMNVAALGNVVAQLHIHHIVRYSTDIAWPAPVWGAHPKKSYSGADLSELIGQLKLGLKNMDLGFQSK